jgi:hypothetical protein
LFFDGRLHPTAEAQPAGDQTLKRFRPRARLRLMTRRPPLVDILFKNPWVLARLSLLG